MQLQGEVAVITGASSGIGAAIARAFAAEGARLVLASRSEEKLAEVARTLGTTGGPALVVPTEVGKPEQVKRLVERTLAEFGRIDIFVNNAGIGMYTPFERVIWEHFRELWEVNFFGAAYAMREVVPIMRRQGRGTIVNISSVAGRIPLPYLSSYCSTKFALNALSDGLRNELVRDGIRVLVVCPGRVRTGFHERAYHDGGAIKYRGRIGGGISAERVARATLRAVVSGKRELVVPWYMRLAIGLHKAFPAITDRLVRALVFRDV